MQSDSHIENEYKTQVEQAYEKYVKEKLDQTIRKCQALNCDVFDFGHKAAAKFRTIQDWEEYDRLSRFKDAEVETEVDFIMRRTGALITTEEEKEAQES